MSLNEKVRVSKGQVVIYSNGKRSEVRLPEHGVIIIKIADGVPVQFEVTEKNLIN